MQPEEPGEAADHEFVRWARGLGLTRHMLSPHYQMVKDKVLDGQRLYPDITFPDISGKELLLLNDGSYLHIRKDFADGNVKSVMLYGESYVIRNDELQKICGHEEAVKLKAE